MKDTIYRQDAIDALQKEINKGIPPFDDVIGSIRCGVRLARNIIEDLPSAEPEIIRCHKCIHWQMDTVRQNSNDAGWWNEAVCGKYSDDIWTAWKDADWFCGDAERRTDEAD